MRESLAVAAPPAVAWNEEGGDDTAGSQEDLAITQGLPDDDIAYRWSARESGKQAEGGGVRETPGGARGTPGGAGSSGSAYDAPTTACTDTTDLPTAYADEVTDRKGILDTVTYLRLNQRLVGEPLNQGVLHRCGGVVQQFKFADVWVNGSDVQVYLSGDRQLEKYTLSGGQLARYEVTSSIDYDETDFLNHLSTYSRRPTLFVLTHGLVTSGLSTEGGGPRGYGLDSWQNRLAGNLAREANAVGSMVHVMKVDWASQSPNTSATKQVGDHIKSFLKGGTSQWDVMMVGHSRGGVFTADLARELDRDGHTARFDGEVPSSLGAVERIRTLQVVMLDPTAAVSLGDIYPSRMPGGVDRAMDYDDGMQLYPFGLTRDTLPIAGAERVLVTVPDAAGDVATSHNDLPIWYAEAERREWTRTGESAKLVYSGDLAWTLGQKPVRARGVFHRAVGLGTEVVLVRPPAGALNVIDIGFWVRNGDAHGYISIAGIGGAAVTIGKSGVDVNAGLTVTGSGAVSLSDRGLVVGYAGPGVGPLSVGAGVVVGVDETRADVNAGPVRVSLSSSGVGVSIGGVAMTVDESSNVSAGNLQINHLMPGGKTVADTFANGVKTFHQTWEADGRHVEETFANGVKTMQRTWEVGGRVVESTYKNGVEATRKAWEAGNRYTESTIENGVEKARTTYVNGKKTLVHVRDAAGNFIEHVIDVSGNPIVSRVIPSWPWAG